MVKTKEQIVYDLLFNQKITPEEAEVLMQEPQWKFDPNTWVAPNDLVTPVYPVPGPTCKVYDTNGLFHCKLVADNQNWIITN